MTSRHTYLAAAMLAVCALVAALGVAAPATGKKKKDQRPNVVVIMSDDQTQDSMRYMPQTTQQLGGEGATFANSFASFPLCCPSRATYLTGQYPHNHGVLSNDEEEEGGYLSLDSTNTLAVWLQQAGYYTAHIGKYLNGYEQVPNTIPPGWTEWRGSTRTYRFYGYQLNEQGVLVDYGDTEDQYSTDVYTQKAVDLIHRQAPQRRPFFLSLAYLAPHGGGPDRNPPQPPNDCANTAKPAPRHANAFDSEPLPQPPSFNEADVSDKPAAIQTRDPFTDAEIENIQREYRCRIESLLAVDDGVAQVIQALRDEGEFEDTVFVYTSDNGFFQGEHRVGQGKTRVYEPSIRVPLILHAPGVPNGVTVDDLVVNNDLAPTIVELTGAKPERTMDGLSLMPVAESPGLLRGRAILIETRSYTAVRTARYVYVENATGELELYDLANDPHQLQSLHADPAYDEPEAALAHLLGQLRTCSGSGCRQTPFLDLKLAFRDGEPGRRECARGAVTARLKGPDAGLVTGTVQFSVGSKDAGADEAGPYGLRVPGARLKKRGKSSVIATLATIDGREMTLDERVRRCA